VAGTPDSFLGKEAVLFGPSGFPSVDEWAQASGSINYEIITRISGRVTRSYVDSGSAVGAVSLDADSEAVLP